MKDNASKGLLWSKTFWAAVIPILVSIGQLSDQYFHTSIMSNHLIGLALGVAGMLGIYGRVTADTKIEGMI